MTLDPNTLLFDLDLLEAIERATLRLVVQAVYDFRDEANEIFYQERDLVTDIGEDITREALDRLGTSVIPVCLFGRVDYKRARYVFHSDYSVRQALFVDSKAEKIEGARTATIQTGQTSMRIRQTRSGSVVDEAGGLPSVLETQGGSFLTTTIFVKYNYRSVPGAKNQLVNISFTCLSNGMLQNRYNPTADDTFWLAGRNAPSRGEPFRVRIGLAALKRKANWRVQLIQVSPGLSFSWED